MHFYVQNFVTAAVSFHVAGILYSLAQRTAIGTGNPFLLMDKCHFFDDFTLESIY